MMIFFWIILRPSTYTVCGKFDFKTNVTFDHTLPYIRIYEFYDKSIIIYQFTEIFTPHFTSIKIPNKTWNHAVKKSKLSFYIKHVVT